MNALRLEKDEFTAGFQDTALKTGLSDSGQADDTTLDPHFARAVDALFNLDDMGRRLDLEVSDVPYDALIRISGELHKFGVTNNLATEFVEAIEAQAVHLGVDFTRKEKPTPLTISLRIMDKAPDLEKDKTHFMVAWDRRGKHGSDYSSVEAHLTNTGTKITTTNVPKFEDLFSKGNEKYLVAHFVKLEGEELEGLDESGVDMATFVEAVGPVGAESASGGKVRQAIESGTISPAMRELIQTVASVNQVADASRTPGAVENAGTKISNLKVQVAELTHKVAMSENIPAVLVKAATQVIDLPVPADTVKISVAGMARAENAAPVVADNDNANAPAKGIENKAAQMADVAISATEPVQVQAKIEASAVDVAKPAVSEMSDVKIAAADVKSAVQDTAVAKVDTAAASKADVVSAVVSKSEASVLDVAKPSVAEAQVAKPAAAEVKTAGDVAAVKVEAAAIKTDVATKPEMSASEAAKPSTVEVKEVKSTAAEMKNTAPDVSVAKADAVVSKADTVAVVAAVTKSDVSVSEIAKPSMSAAQTPKEIVADVKNVAPVTVQPATAEVKTFVPPVSVVTGNVLVKPVEASVPATPTQFVGSGVGRGSSYVAPAPAQPPAPPAPAPIAPPQFNTPVTPPSSNSQPDQPPVNRAAPQPQPQPVKPPEFRKEEVLPVPGKPPVNPPSNQLPDNRPEGFKPPHNPLPSNPVIPQVAPTGHNLPSPPLPKPVSLPEFVVKNPKALDNIPSKFDDVKKALGDGKITYDKINDIVKEFPPQDRAEVIKLINTHTEVRHDFVDRGPTPAPVNDRFDKGDNVFNRPPLDFKETERKSPIKTDSDIVSDKTPTNEFKKCAGPCPVGCTGCGNAFNVSARSDKEKAYTPAHKGIKLTMS